MKNIFKKGGKQKEEEGKLSFIHKVDEKLTNFLEEAHKETTLNITKLWIAFILIFTAILSYYSFSGLSIIIREIPKAINEIKRDISDEELEIYNNLLKLPDTPLDNLESNINKVMSLRNFPLGKVSIEIQEKSENQKKKEKKEGLDLENRRVGLSRVGRFQSLKIKFEGDIFEQMYFLRILDKMRYFAVFQFIKGDPNKVEFIIRVYGK